MKEINIDLIKDNWQSLIKEIEKKEVSDLITLTIHVPFCSQKCKFCNCYVRKSDHKVLENFMNILEEQIKEFSFIFKEYTFKRLFISGGSPSSLGKKRIEKIFTLLYDNFNFSLDTYIIYEIDNIYTNEDIYKILAKYPGEKLMCLGIQSMNKETLNSISRRQIPERVKNLNDLAKKYNFHFSVDLILGLPGDTLNTFKDTLDFVHGLSPNVINFFRLEQNGIVSKYKDLFNLEKKNYDLIREMFKYIEKFYANKTGLLGYLLNGFGGNDYRHLSYFSDEKKFSSHDWREIGSVLNLGYGDKSFILGKLQYEYFPWDLMDSYEEVKEFKYTGKILDIRDSMKKYFLMRFTTFIDPIYFEKVFKKSLFKEFVKELKFLEKHGKIIQKEDKITFDFKSDAELIFFQRIIYKIK